MDFISVLSCLSLLLAAAAAQAPKPCTVPPLMSGSFSLMSTNVMSTGSMTYDAFGQRMRVRVRVSAGNETFAVDQLMLFNQKVYYEIDWSKFSCKKKALDNKFIPMSVPADALLAGQVVLGSSSSWGMGVLVNTWVGWVPEISLSYSSVFTEIGCIPVTITGSGPFGWAFLSTYNWVLGTPNTMDFFPPLFCTQSSKLEETETPDTVFTALVSLAKKTKNVK